MHLDEMMGDWDPGTKPPADICPEKYCFQWVPPGGSADLSGKGHDTLESAIEAGKRGTDFPDGGCGSIFGTCKRFSKQSGDKDLYEPNEPCLCNSGLHDLYFCSKESLSGEGQARYQAMAEELWEDA